MTQTPAVRAPPLERAPSVAPAPPVDGKANEALIKFVAETLKLPKSAVNLKSGQTSRRKVLEVIGAESSAIAGFAAL